MLFSEGFTGKRIVDLGCLEGDYTVEFARSGFDALGIEVRQGNFENCQRVKAGTNLSTLEFARDDVLNLASSPVNQRLATGDPWSERYRRLNAGDRCSGNAVPTWLPDVLEVGSDGQETAVTPAVVHFQYLLGAGAGYVVANLSINPARRGHVVLACWYQSLIARARAPEQRYDTDKRF